MRIRFECKGSYQDTMGYTIYGVSERASIDVFQGNSHQLEYMERTHNHCGDVTSFERNVLSRQGGAVLRIDGTQAHWTPDLYRTFVEWLTQRYADGLAQWTAKCERNGWGAEDLAAYGPMAAIPRPMYFDHEAKRYQVEDWFKSVTLAA